MKINWNTSDYKGKSVIEITQNNSLPHEQKINLMLEAVANKMNFEPNEGRTQENSCAKTCSTLLSHKLKLKKQLEEQIKMREKDPTKNESQPPRLNDNKSTFFNEKNVQHQDSNSNIRIQSDDKKNNNPDETVAILSDEKQSLLPQNSNSCGSVNKSV